MRGFLMFVGAIFFSGILGVGVYWFLMNTKFNKIRPTDNSDDSPVDLDQEEKE